LNPDDAALKKPRVIECKYGKIETVIVPNPINGKTALKRELLDVVGA
jgi:hypothetical protein